MVKVLFIHANGNPYRDKRLIEELQAHKDVNFITSDYKTVLWSLKNNPHKIDADCVININRCKELGELLEKDGVKCFNKQTEAFLANDKWETYIKLNEINIPQPKTSLTQDFKPPFIYKDRFGAYGKKVELIETNKKLSNKNKKYIFQEYIEESKGKSIRVVMIDKKPVACSLKVNEKSFLSHYAHGGTDQYYELTDELAALCSKVATHLDLDYCALDLLISNNGLLVLEVNSGAGLKGIEDFTGVNIAKKYVDYIVDNVKQTINS